MKITPVKSKQQVSGSPSSLADAGSLSYPSLPESGEDPLPSSSSSSTTQRPPGSVQRVGDEHMFHQKVIPHGRFSSLLPSYLRVLVLCVKLSPTDTAQLWYIHVRQNLMHLQCMANVTGTNS